MHCGLCHECGTRLIKCLDGEEWCPHCHAYRRYFTHGWSPAYQEFIPCLKINQGTHVGGEPEEANESPAGTSAS